MAYNWLPLLGRFERTGNTLVFKGAQHRIPEGQHGAGAPVAEVGNLITDQLFGGGTISAEIKFLENSLFELLPNHRAVQLLHVPYGG